MYKLLAKHGQLIAFGLGLVVLLIFFGSALSGLDTFNSLPDGQKKTSNIFNNGLWGAIAMFALTILVLVVTSFISLFSNLKGSMMGILGFVAILVIFAIFYFTAKEDAAYLLPTLAEFNITPTISKVISAALWTTIAMAVISLLAFIGSEIMGLFR